jgi:hypothetical protein
MTTYKLMQVDPQTGKTEVVQRLPENYYIPFAVGNTDYANFKSQINNDEAQLENIDGVVMTPEEAKAYVATLP